jgi:hypothetical protein
MEKEFKVFYGTTAATKEQLDAIEQIVVEQEVGRAWEARIKIPVCIAEDGSWDSENEPAYAEFARVRVEVKIGEGEFVPLIDGRIVEQQPDLNASPGLSAITLVVHDDTTLLHRDEGSEPYTGTDSDIAMTILSDAELGGIVEVEATTAGADTEAVTNRNGTRMQMLREIMTRNPGFHAYVQPGADVSTSDAFFKKLPTEPDASLPTMFMSGSDQNIGSFSIQRNSARAATVEASHLSMSDKSVTNATASHADAPPTAGETSTGGTAIDTRVRRLDPGVGDHADLNEAAAGAADESSYTLSAEGSVIPSCYSAVLSPYRMVSVRLSNSRYSSDYVIYKVVHTLGISEYTQSFSVRGNAVAPEASASASLPSASAALAFSFNVQVDIF